MFETFLQRKKKDINFLKAYNLSNKKRDYNFRQTMYILIGELAIFVILAVVLLYKATYYKIQNDNLTKKIDKLQTIEQQLKEFQSIKALYENKLALNNNVINDNKTISNAIKELEKITPSEIVYENMNITSQKIMFIIKSSKEENIEQFIYNLQNSNKFQNITFNGISNQNNIKRTSITADIVRK